MATTDQQVGQAVQVVLVDFVFAPLRNDGFSPDAIARIVRRAVTRITDEMNEEDA